MEFRLFIVSLIVTSPALTAVIKNENDICSLNEFHCGDGACVNFDRVCDGEANCADASDENTCFSLSNNNNDEVTLHRNKRQAACRKNQWQCRDGTCIGFDGKCDGVVNCPDGSDETYPLCRNNRCQSNWFRCTYGACVDGTAPCNGVQECADNSDEYQPKCFNETLEVQGQFKCQDGSLVPSADRCDGVPDCRDGSDETVRACAANQCLAYLTRCAYGACVDQGSECDGKIDCVDGSDESGELCNRMGGSGGAVTPTSRPPTNLQSKCILPPFPKHGTYSVQGVAKPVPGNALVTVFLTVLCDREYGTIENNTQICFDGTWLGDIPQCERFCRLNSDPSVEYRCQIPASFGGTRPCKDYEPRDTVVIPTCKPNYSASSITYMKCIEGSWDQVFTCQPDCGTVTPEGAILSIGGRFAKRGEFPWHVGIYTKLTEPYKQICGGTIVKTSIVLSAAHCFWNDIDKLLPASNYAVAAGKLYRPWNNPKDVDAQKRDVTDIKIPENFRGNDANFQSDIAVVVVSSAFEYRPFIRPVCVDFDIRFEKNQLAQGTIGKVAGWGLDAENGDASQTLRVVELPYVPISTCFNETPPAFHQLITSDKMCAGYRNGTAALCHGDSGGGLTFPERERGIERYYLRGIVSTSPTNEHKCNAYAITTFTRIINHEFIKDYTSSYRF